MLQLGAVSTSATVGAGIQVNHRVSARIRSLPVKKGFCPEQGRRVRISRPGNRKRAVRRGGELGHTCLVDSSKLIRVDEESSDVECLKLMKFPLPDDKGHTPFSLGFNSDNAASASLSLQLLKNSDSPSLDISVPFSDTSSPSVSFTLPLPKEVTISLSMPLSQHQDTSAALDLTSGSTLEVTAGKSKASLPVPGQYVMSMLHSFPIHYPNLQLLKVHIPALLSSPISVPM